MSHEIPFLSFNRSCAAVFGTLRCRSCTATFAFLQCGCHFDQKLRCSKRKTAARHCKNCIARKWRFPAAFQAPTFRHPRLGPADSWGAPGTRPKNDNTKVTLGPLYRANGRGRFGGQTAGGDPNAFPQLKLPLSLCNASTERARKCLQG